MADLDFEIEVRKTASGYDLAVLSSPAGEARLSAEFPFDGLALQNRLQALEIALLRSGGERRSALTDDEQKVQDFGGELFDWLIQGEVRSRFDESRNTARGREKALRVRLRFVDAPAMAALPWEFLYDRRDGGDYVVLSARTPLVRYVELSAPTAPLTVRPPLRMLALAASPNDLPKLDAERERQRLDEATRDLQERGLLKVHWLPAATYEDLSDALQRERWHIFHFVGHGGEGFVALVDEQGATFRLAATHLGRLLGDHQSLRLAVLNTCEGAKGNDRDLFASTAATLIRRGTPAVVAMQYVITDRAAIEFSRAFYDAIADGSPVDVAMALSRQTVSAKIDNTLEWGTPVLFMRSPDGVLFRRSMLEPSQPPTPRPVPPEVPPEHKPQPDAGKGTPGPRPGCSVRVSVVVGATVALVMAATTSISFLGGIGAPVTPMPTERPTPTARASPTHVLFLLPPHGVPPPEPVPRPSSR